MKLKQFLKAADGQVCGGSQYQWDCFGPNAQFLDVSDISGNEVGGCIFDRKTQLVYQVEVHVYDDNISYRWMDPDFVAEYGMEADRRKVSKFNAYDDVDYNDLPTEDEILDVVHRVVHETYVHSKPIKGLNLAAPWPFPAEGSMTSNQEDAALDGDDADWGHDGDGNNEGMFGDFDVDEFRAMAAGVNQNPVESKQEFEVVLSVKHRFSVKARNMEAACDKAKEFEKSMKSGDWPTGLCWEDKWVSKVSATKRLETTHIEE